MATDLGNSLTIQGEFTAAAEQEQGQQYLYRQLLRDRFEQTITVPTDIDADKIEARSENSLLRLRLPKVETARRRRVAIQGGQTQQLQGQPQQR